MGSIPLVALSVKTPEAPDALEKYGRLTQLRGLQQEQQQRAAMAPIQQQLGQQAVQQGQIATQQALQGQKDQEAFRAAMQDPSMQGQTIGGIADALAHKGAISQSGWVAAKKADLEHQQSLMKLSTEQLDNLAKGHAATQQLYNNIQQMPDDQLAQAWPQIAQQYNLIPGNDKAPLNPQQPLSKQQLAQFGPMISMNDAYLNNAMARKKAGVEEQTAEADLTKKQQEASYGPTGPAADAKYSFLEKKMALKQPLSADDHAWMEGYKKQKLLVPGTTATLRMEGIGQTREYPVYDSKQKATVMVTPNEINRAAKEEPGRYTAASYTPESIGAKTSTEYFTKGKGGQQLTAFNTAMEHLDTLSKLSNDLGNSSIQVFNKAAQAWATQTGNPAPANFAAAKNAMSGEVAAALKASGATDLEIAKVGETFDRAQSPAQLQGAIGTYRSLLKTKEKNLRGQYQQGMQGRPNFEGQGGAQPSANDPLGIR